MEKKYIKLIIIFLIVVIGGIVTYYTIFKGKDTPENEEQKVKTSYERCRDITDQNICNSSIDDQSKKRRCEYNTTIKHNNNNI